MQLHKACSDWFTFLHFFFGEPTDLCVSLKSYRARSPLEIPRAFENLEGSRLTWDVDAGRQGRGGDITCKHRLLWRLGALGSLGGMHCFWHFSPQTHRPTQLVGSTSLQKLV